MLTIQNASGSVLQLTDSASNVFRLLGGDSATFYGSSLPLSVLWTNGTTGTLTSSGVYQRTLVGGPGFSDSQSWDWVWIAPLVVWALWLATKMNLRLLSRTFGASSDNTVE